MTISQSPMSVRSNLIPFVLRYDFAAAIRLRIYLSYCVVINWRFSFVISSNSLSVMPFYLCYGFAGVFASSDGNVIAVEAVGASCVMLITPNASGMTGTPSYLAVPLNTVLSSINL